MIDFSSPLTRDFFENGFSDDCPIIDMHAHMFNYAGGRMIADTPKKVLSYMERANVRLAVFSSHRTLMDGFCADYDLNIWKSYPKNFRLYYPVLSKKANAERDIRIVDENPAYIGFKFLCDYYRVPLEDKRHEPYLEYANTKKMPILCHTWGHSEFDGVNNARKVLRKYSDLTFLAGHSFRGDEDEACKIGKDFENLYFELTAVLSETGRLEKLLDAGLMERIVFGVDAPWFSYHSYIGALLSAGIDDDTIKDILFRNALTVLNKSTAEKEYLHEILI
ncbi:MAG TPA: amidohydrolase family protein [Clostridia bacterium]|nr:amidohydrolase family protein [Clostridia bacterium]